MQKTMASFISYFTQCEADAMVLAQACIVSDAKLTSYLYALKVLVSDNSGNSSSSYNLLFVLSKPPPLFCEYIYISPKLIVPRFCSTVTN